MEVFVDGVVYLFKKIGEGITWLLKEGLIIIGKAAVVCIKELAGYPDIFVFVAVTGMIIVITGRKELGTKITSGSMLAYLVSKVVAERC